MPPSLNRTGKRVERLCVNLPYVHLHAFQRGGSIWTVRPNPLTVEEVKMKESLEFYDIKEKNKFPSTEWRIVEKTSGNRTRYFAVAPRADGSGP